MGINILKTEIGRLGISNIAMSSPQDRRQLAYVIRKMLPSHSLGRRQMIFSELLKILNVDVADKRKSRFDAGDTFIDETGKRLSQKEFIEKKDKEKIFFSNDEFERYKDLKKKMVIEGFWHNIDQSLTKFELVFNLFWLKAGEAEIRGMSHQDVMKVTNKAMLAIREGLEDSYQDLQKTLDIFEKNKLESNYKFQFDHKKLVSSGLDNMDDEKEKLKGDIEEFWDVVDKTYFQFKELFFKSLNEEINIKKQGQRDSHLIHETQDNMVHIWKTIETEYFKLREKLNLDKNEERITKSVGS